MALFDDAYNDVAELVRKFEEHRADFKWELFPPKCDYLDGEIDKLVYQLYGLTEEEIKIVEGRG